MSNGKCLVRVPTIGHGRPALMGFCSTLRSLIVAVSVAGCATTAPAPDMAPPVRVAESTWRQVDTDIMAASLVATGPASNYARGSMESWRNRVRQCTEADFVPWFTGYWTQQWLAIKVAWYKLGAGDGDDPAVTRLAAYLQEQYRDRVLEPVAREIDPDRVRAQAAMLYIRLLAEQLQGIPVRYGVPQGQFDTRLRGIPAIVLAPPVSHNASLYQLVHTDPIADLPAFVALIAQVREAGSGGAGPSEARISPVAKRASEQLVAKLATAGGASAAAAAVGGVAGVVISLGAAGFGAIAHENDRPAMEARLRENLDAALDDMWLDLVEDTGSGVMAVVTHIAGKVEGHLGERLTLPPDLVPLPEYLPVPSHQRFQSGDMNEEGTADDGKIDE